MVKFLKLEPHDEVILAAARHIAGATNDYHTPSLGIGEGAPMKSAEPHVLKSAVFNILSLHIEKAATVKIDPQVAYDNLARTAKVLAKAAIPQTIQHEGRTYRLVEEGPRQASRRGCGPRWL